MQNTSLKIEIDTTSIDAALEKVRQLKAELRQLGLPYVTGNSLGLAGDIDKIETARDSSA